MKLSYYKINPTGNITLIVETPVLRESQSRIAAELMALDAEAEQVGFIEKPVSSDADLRLQMMGGEFCGNASISAAALTAMQRGLDALSLSLEVSGIDKPIELKVRKECGHSYCGTVQMPLPERIDSVSLNGFSFPIVHFSGISHIVADERLRADFAEENIGTLCARLGLDALGIMFVDGESLKPYVYVAATDTAVWESSCASGTCAVAAYRAVQSGRTQSLSLNQRGGTLTACAEYDSGVLTSLLLSASAEIIGNSLIYI